MATCNSCKKKYSYDRLRGGICRGCITGRKEYDAKRYADNRERDLARCREYHKKNRLVINARKREKLKKKRRAVARAGHWIGPEGTAKDFNMNVATVKTWMKRYYVPVGEV